ncbi:hypothetical protein K504DRAFT_501241 [Pleomassaria siparia CBS 279.74]|uniref:DUF4604 domain-containing protein n=1 Tax=Pleomassaria siparia CBS 279.74 TaxID=1314801 RepID=A0A6G1KBX3_9PLEO|nr:hypothetical protein K504DRAFT_501241 [Pleomassaria siparia CBS 279.74]
MSFKAKDLHYDDTQPAFLRRMRGEISGHGSGRHEQPIARPKRLKQDDEDDAPTYVLEDTHESLSKAEYEAMLAGNDRKEEDAASEGTDAKSKPTEIVPEKPKDNIAELGKASKKRKVAKVIAEEQEGENATGTSTTKAVKKIKKKSKPVKLSFGDQEEG